MKNLPRKTHQTRTARRSIMAAEVAAGKYTRAQVAGRYGVTLGTVANACREHGVTPRRVPGPLDPTRAAEVVERFLMGENKQTIGLAFGITRERTRQIVAAMERNDPVQFRLIKRRTLFKQLEALDGQLEALDGAA